MKIEEINPATSLSPIMFWGVTIDAGKRYSQTVEEGFRLSMAALESKTEHNGEYVQVLLQQESSEFLLCTLQHGKLLQQPMELLFSAGETVSFSLNGTGTVHLTGYLVLQDFDNMEEDPDWDETTYDEEGEEEDDEDDSSDDEEIPDLVPTGKRKADALLKKSKKIKLLNDDEEVDDDSDDDSDDDDSDDDDDEEEEEDFSDDFEGESFFDEEASEDDEEEDDDEEDDDDDDDDDMETSAPPTPQSAKQKKQNTPKQAENTPKQKQKTPKQEQKTPKQEQKTPKQKEQTPKQNKKTPKENGKTPKENGETPKSAEAPDSQKKSKKKTPKAQTPKAEVETPKSEVSDNQSTPAADGDKKKKKKKKKNKQQADSEADSIMNVSKAETPTSATKSTPKKRVVTGGTVVEDLKDGHGPEAKPGKMVGVYYKGVLQKNNKQFDSCLAGKPFRFRLNKGEVIKGWDSGVSGMKVGGKRRITVPASQGYGNRGNGPIPANSVLVFDVELKSVS